MNSPIYTFLSSIIYPVCNKKLRDVTGTEHIPLAGGYLLACNHVDWLDGFYVAAAVGKACARPTNFLTRSNNYWWTTVAVQIPEDRGVIVDQAVDQLRRGKVICNFPEGERNATQKLSPGKTGTVRMAAEAGVPVIPVGITCDTGRNMGESLQYLFSSQHPVALSFGQPLTFTLPTEGITAQWLESETARLMRAIAPLAGKTV